MIGTSTGIVVVVMISCRLVKPLTFLAVSDRLSGCCSHTTQNHLRFDLCLLPDEAAVVAGVHHSVRRSRRD